MTAGLRLLLVEDNPGDARLIREMLRDVPGFTLRWVQDLKSAMSVMREGAVDALLLDLGLPDSVGIPSVKVVHESFPRVPIVILTGQDSQTISLHAVKAGAQDYLVKGKVDTDRLVRSIRYARERFTVEEELRASEDRLRKSNRELRETTAQLIQTAKLTALGELAAGVAHELNQPLNCIAIICQAMVRYPESYGQDELKSELAQVLSLVESMRRIIDHMRLFARRSNEVEFKELDMNALLDRALAFVEQQTRNHGIDLRRDYHPDLPVLWGDAARLEQVFLNLMINARGALDDSEATNKFIVVRTLVGDHEVIVEVQDNGSGIPARLRNRIFEPFFTTKEPGKGTGLGLSIALKLIQEHRGVIEVDSREGFGSTFRIRLPTDPPPVRTPSGRPLTGSTASGRPAPGSGRPDPAGPASEHQEPGTFSGVRKEPGTFSGVRKEPGTFSGARKEPGTFSGARKEPGTFSGVRKEPGTFSGARKEPGTLSGVRREPGTLSGVRREPGTFSGVRREPGTLSGARKEPGAADSGRPEPGAPDSGSKEPDAPDSGRQEPGAPK
ncbi:MAG: response regulator [Deltaproteobacteria bacterium]|nr:response regulator [Deltaproteobacteria bacterium]